MKKLHFVLFVLVITLCTQTAMAQAIVSTQAHEGKVNFLLSCEMDDLADEAFYSAGSDGFLIKWGSDGMGDHYQVSELEVRQVAQNPNTDDIAVVESDGISNHRLTVFDTRTWTRKFSKKFVNPITCISFSAKGSYLLAGTQAASGTFVLNAKTGDVLQRADEVLGVVPLILTGESEKTAVMYSRSGFLYYYDLQAATVKTKFPTVSALDQPLLFGTGKLKNRFLAGVKDGMIYVIDATSGAVLWRHQVSSPLIFSGKFHQDEKQGLYFTCDEGRSFALKLLDQMRLEDLLSGKEDVEPLLVKTFSGLKSQDKITCAAKNSGTVFLGTQSGDVYTMSDAQESEMYSLFALTENMYQKILDMEVDGSNFYFLTHESIFKTSYDAKTAETLSTSFSHTNMTKTSMGLVLWTRGQDREPRIVDFYGGMKPISLFKPPAPLRVLRVFGNKIIYVAGTSIVGVYDLEAQEGGILYTGTSIQDAVLTSEGELIVAKTSTGSGDSPLVSVNISTLETVPFLNVAGDVVFSLSLDESTGMPLIYGVSIEAQGSEAKTRVFNYALKSGIESFILSLATEDSTAFTNVSMPYVFTNIGKNQVRAYNIYTRKTTTFTRSASMPLKTTVSRDRLAVLNRNGSISWYNPASKTLLADWYLTVDGEWFEF